MSSGGRHELVETTARVIDQPGNVRVPVMHCTLCSGTWRLDEPHADVVLLRSAPCPAVGVSLLDLYG